MVNKELVQKALDTIPDDLLYDAYFRDDRVCGVGHLMKVAGKGPDNLSEYSFGTNLAREYGVDINDISLVIDDMYTETLDPTVRKKNMTERLQKWLKRE